MHRLRPLAAALACAAGEGDTTTSGFGNTPSFSNSSTNTSGRLRGTSCPSM